MSKIECPECGFDYEGLHSSDCSRSMPRCFCGKALEISPPIPEGQKHDPGTTYNFLCPVHGDATSAESNYRRMVEAEAERDRLRELVREMDDSTLILRQEAWPEADLYLHGSKIPARAIRTSDVRRIKALGEECAEALEPTT